jgi:mono/diheme cytochrome c family protein
MSNTGKGEKNRFAEIKENPASIFLIIYPYVLIIGIAIGLFYMHRLNEIERKTVPPAAPDTVAEQTDLKLIEPSTEAKVNLAALIQPSDSLIKIGKELFTTNCVSCHGADGKGDGVAAKSLNPAPRNYTSKEHWINGPTLAGIYKTLSEGINGSAMVAFNNFSPEQKFALAHYIRQTFVPDPPKDTKEDIENLDQKYNLSKGESNPGQIPVEDAMLLMEKEDSTKYDNLVSILNKISKDSNNEGAAIFEKVTDDKLRAITMLSNTDEWHKNEQVFVDLIVNELSEDGFNDKVHQLTDKEWDEFYNYMSQYF